MGINESSEGRYDFAKKSKSIMVYRFITNL